MMGRTFFVILAVSIGLLCIAIVPHKPLLVWNASASAPIGLYAVAPIYSLRRGDLVFAYPPQTAESLAAERGYLPRGVPLVKYIAALHGDRICADGLHVSINGSEAITRLPRDGQGRALPSWRGCRMLTADEVFLLNAAILHSFDGRYFGAIPSENIIGRLVPLWVR